MTPKDPTTKQTHSLKDSSARDEEKVEKPHFVETNFVPEPPFLRNVASSKHIKIFSQKDTVGEEAINIHKRTERDNTPPKLKLRKDHTGPG